MRLFVVVLVGGSFLKIWFCRCLCVRVADLECEWMEIQRRIKV